MKTNKPKRKKKKMKTLEDKIKKIQKEALNDSYFLKAKNCFWTSYFSMKDSDKYKAIFADDIDSFGLKVRQDAEKYVLDNQTQ